MPKGLSGFDMNIWRENKLIEFTKKYPDDPPGKLKERLWGYRTDEDGTEVTSSEFGTKAHAGLEEALKQYQDGADYLGPYKQYANKFIEHISNVQTAPVHMELSVLDDDLNVAGMLDLICMNKSGSTSCTTSSSGTIRTRVTIRTAVSYPLKPRLLQSSGT